MAVCLDCHGSTLAGRVFLDDPLSGRFVAPNLTRGRGGIGASVSDADFVRAIRYGVDPGGRQVLVMPSADYWIFGDTDLSDIIAYVRAVPAVESDLPPSQIAPMGRALFAVGQLELLPATSIDYAVPRPQPPEIGATAEYGEYLANAAGCPRCHGAGLSGGKMPQAPPGRLAAANITPAGLADWSEADFFRAMRTGTRPDGRVLSSVMPWPYFAQMTDDELRAIWRFLQVVPPRPTGSH